jgi:hypothetical protein
MYRLIRRRLVALAVAYALALGPTLPLLTAFATAAETGPAILSDICATDKSGAGSDADAPSRHRPACPLGMMCLAQDCGANCCPAAGAHGTALTGFAFRSFLSFIPFDHETFVPRNIGAQFARAPPRI